jgi:hypothetical protein
MVAPLKERAAAALWFGVVEPLAELRVTDFEPSGFAAQELN